MNRALIVAAACALCLTAGVCAAQDTAVRGRLQPGKIIPTADGQVILPTSLDVQVYDRFKYAAARRAGNTLYVSGVVIGPVGTEARDADAFRAQVRRGFQTLDRTLKAAGIGWANVTMINSFHVFGGKGFAGSKREQFEIVSAVREEFMKGLPHPAWTAIGVSELLPDDGVVEIQLIAHAPNAPPAMSAAVKPAA
jgi:enamine deaminase RidA (YjgF/YER057c/UK114 family)